MPLLNRVANRKRKRSSAQLKRKRGSSTVDNSSDPLQSLTVYDPYYCKGRVCDALAALGLARESVINVNRDFYSDISKRTVPTHDVLLTNPPYSGDHKQRLLRFLVDARQSGLDGDGPCPFFLLMPAWLAATVVTSFANSRVVEGDLHVPLLMPPHRASGLLGCLCGGARDQAERSAERRGSDQP